MSNSLTFDNVAWRRRLLQPSLVSQYQERRNVSHHDSTHLLVDPPWVLQLQNSPMTGTFPSTNYLALRRQQNIAWANDRLQVGVDHAHSNEAEQALQAYNQGLELVPNHADLLVAKGALFANQGKNDAAMELLQQALAYDPQHANARQYLRQIQQFRRKPALVEKSQRFQQDALIEQAFGKGQSVATAASIRMSTGQQHASHDIYPLFPVENDHDIPRNEHNRKRHKRTKKKRRRQYSSSTSSSSIDPSDLPRSDSEDKRRDRKRRKRKKKQKHCRQRYDSDSDSITSVDCESSHHKEKIRRRHRSRRSNASASTKDSVEMMIEKRDSDKSRKKKGEPNRS